MTMIAHTLDPVTTARAALDQVHARVADVLAERAGLLNECHTALQSAGYTVVVARRSFKSPPNGDGLWRIWDSFEECRGVKHRRDLFKLSDAAEWHPGCGQQSWSEGTMYIEHGPYRIVLADKAPSPRYGLDEYDLLLVKDPDADSETGHRRSVGRLRNLARHDGIRVRVRDRDITLIDPLDNVVHTGDVVSSFAFLLNLDIENAEEW